MSNVKISTFPDASTNMASADRVTGLQGGANVNFSQTQILTGITGTTGGTINLHGGDATNGTGGKLYAYAGAGGGATGTGGAWNGGGGNAAGNASGGEALFQGGTGAGTGAGGNVTVSGGNADNAGSGNGGYVIITGGAPGTNNVAGGIFISGGPSNSAGGTAGYVSIQPGQATGGASSGNLFLNSIPTTDPAVTNAVFFKNKILMQSGVTNFSGTITTGSLVGKTITVVNGIITGFA